MEPLKVVTHDAQTGEITERVLTKAEIEQLEKEYAEYLAANPEIEIEAAKAKEKQAKRESAIAKLAALGLTEDEIAAL